MKKYHEIKAERKARTEAEKERGQIAVKLTMANGVVNKLMSEMDPSRNVNGHITPNTMDIRKWVVCVDLKEGGIHEENFFDFPTDELRTKMMLLKK